MRMRYELFVHPIKTLRRLRYHYFDSAYDWWLGIGTKHSASDAGDVSDLDPYDPTQPKYLFWAFRNLPIEALEYSFVDFGSGKGSVLIAAAKHSFLQVVGVEHSRDLHQAAMANMRSAKRTKCTNISSVCMDAKEFSVPQRPCVIYSYNPLKFGQDPIAPSPSRHFYSSPGLSLFKSGNWCNLYSWRADY